MMDKGCLGDSDCVKQVAEMRPFYKKMQALKIEYMLAY